MKYSSFLLSVFFLISLLVGCSSDSPTVPPTIQGGTDEIVGTNPIESPAANLELDSPRVVEGSGVFTFDGIVPFDCVGEDVHSVVYAPYTYRLIQLPNGNYVYVEHWDTEAVTGTLTGMETGTVWTRLQNVSPYIERSTGGGMVHYTFRSTFESETGPTVEVREVFHVVSNNNGVIVSEISEFRCWLR